MKKSFILVPAILLLSLSFQAKAEFRDTVKTNIRDFTDELGYYQIANRDLNDPRFMFRDDKNNIELGIGGTIEVAGLYTFVGTLPDKSFNPVEIWVPTDHANSFDYKVHGSEFHIKAKTNIKGHKIIAYFKVGGNSNYSVSIKQAYISFDGFSIGKIPSFFIDREYGVMQRLVPSPQDRTQPLVGYTYKWKNWEAAGAVELADINLDSYGVENILTDNQPMPDFTLHLKRKFEKGHVQLGFLARDLTYWTRSDLVLGGSGISGHEFGFGLSLSGNYKPAERLKLSGAIVGGKGCAGYIEFFNSSKLDLGKSSIPLDNCYQRMTAVPLFMTAAAAQYNWAPNLTSALCFEYGYIAQPDTVQNIDQTRSSWLIEANFYWNVNDYAYMGFEYYFGHSRSYNEYQALTHDPIGISSRIAAVIAYMF